MHEVITSKTMLCFLLKSFAFLFFITLHAFMKAFVPIVFSYDNFAAYACTRMEVWLKYGEIQNHGAYAYAYGSMVEVSTMLCHVKVWVC